MHSYELTQTTLGSLTVAQVSPTQEFFYFGFIEKCSMARRIGFATSGVTAVHLKSLGCVFLAEVQFCFCNAMFYILALSCTCIEVFKVIDEIPKCDRTFRANYNWSH